MCKEKVFHKGEEGVCELNMVILTLIVLVFSLSDIYFNRLVFYFSTMCLLIFPRIPYTVNPQMRKWAKIAMISLFLFGFYQCSIMAPYHNILFEHMEGLVYWY